MLKHDGTESVLDDEVGRKVVGDDDHRVNHLLDIACNSLFTRIPATHLLYNQILHAFLPSLLASALSIRTMECLHRLRPAHLYL